MEDTLFRRLEEMRKKPPGELFELLERTLDVLRATKEALLEQRREIRTLATAVDSLRSRVDQLVLARTDPVRHAEPVRHVEPEPEPELPPAAEAEPELGPVDEYRHEDEYEHEDAAERAYEVASEDAALEEAAPEELPEEPVYEPRLYEPEPAAVEAEPVDEDPPAEALPEPPAEHVLMLSTPAGYRLVTGEGGEPESSVEIDGIVYVVAQRVRSPFPGDTRPAFVAGPLQRSSDEY